VGAGKRLLGDGTPAKSFKLVEQRSGAGGIVALTYDLAGPVETGTFATEPPTELDRGIAHIRQMDASFDADALAAAARRVFVDVQGAVAARDMSALSSRLTPRMYTTLVGQCDRLRAARHTNRLEQIEVQRAEVTEAWQESGQDYVTVYLAGSLVDYVVDDASAEVVDGTRSPQSFTEYWTFARPVGRNPWKLSAIQTE